MTNTSSATNEGNAIPFSGVFCRSGQDGWWSMTFPKIATTFQRRALSVLRNIGTD
jgi:hypothetical protein